MKMQYDKRRENSEFTVNPMILQATKKFSIIPFSSKASTTVSPKYKQWSVEIICLFRFHYYCYYHYFNHRPDFWRFRRVSITHLYDQLIQNTKVKASAPQWWHFFPCCDLNDSLKFSSNAVGAKKKEKKTKASRSPVTSKRFLAVQVPLPLISAPLSSSLLLSG